MAEATPSLTPHEFVLEAMHNVLVPVLANSKLLADLECRSSERNQMGDAQQQVFVCSNKFWVIYFIHPLKYSI